MKGSLSLDQIEGLIPHIKGRKVHDLGAGDTTLSRGLLALGARMVVAVDKSYEWSTPPEQERLYFSGSHFDRLAATDPVIDVAFISWPQQYATQGLTQLVMRAKTVIYLGSNFGGVVCGSQDLWQHLVTRDWKVQIPHQRNTLIVYGSVSKERRRLLLPEEYSALRSEIDDPHPFGSLDGQQLQFP